MSRAYFILCMTWFEINTEIATMKTFLYGTRWQNCIQSLAIYAYYEWTSTSTSRCDAIWVFCLCVCIHAVLIVSNDSAICVRVCPRDAGTPWTGENSFLLQSLKTNSIMNYDYKSTVSLQTRNYIALLVHSCSNHNNNNSKIKGYIKMKKIGIIQCSEMCWRKMAMVIIHVAVVDTVFITL